MKSKFVAPLLVSIAVSGAVSFNVETQAQSLSTTFRCVTEGRNYATIAERGERVTPPIIVWSTTEFGRDYTPQQRCDLVTDRLNNAVDRNGGRFSNLLLTTGTVNRLPVVCYVNSERGRCNSQNLLFTLDRRNARNPQQALERLVNFGVTGSGDPVVSFAGGSSSRPRSRFISLENIVNEAFEAAEDGEPVDEPNNSNNNGI